MSRHTNPLSMTELDISNCESCGQPLFLDPEECKRFIEERMKQGYIVCSCCGAKQTVEQKDNQ
jgi:RNase P subunit RPR2